MNSIDLKINDYELIYLIRQKNEWAFNILKEKYTPLIYKLAYQSRSKLPCVEIDELIQESIISLYEAITLYREDLNCSFGTFVYLIIDRKQKLLLRDSYRTINNEINYSSMSIVNEDIIEYRETDPKENPKNICFENWKNNALYKSFDKLSNLDKTIIILKLRGYSYNDISNFCKINNKAVDNRLQKIKKNLSKYIKRSEYGVIEEV